jgi:hypothetical protein
MRRSGSIAALAVRQDVPMLERTRHRINSS